MPRNNDSNLSAAIVLGIVLLIEVYFAHPAMEAFNTSIYAAIVVAAFSASMASLFLYELAMLVKSVASA